MKQVLVMHPLPSIPLLYGRWTKCIVISPHFLLSLYHSPNWHYIQNHQHISFSQKLHSIAVIPLPDLSLPPGSPDEAERTCGRRRRIGRWRVGGRRIRGRWIGWRWIRGRWIRRRWVSGNRHRIGRNWHRVRRHRHRKGRGRVGRYGRRNGRRRADGFADVSIEALAIRTLAHQHHRTVKGTAPARTNEACVGKVPDASAAHGILDGTTGIDACGHSLRRRRRRDGNVLGRWGRRGGSRDGGSTDRRDARSRYLQHAIPILCIFVDQGLLEEGSVLGGVMLQALVLPSEEVTDPRLFGIGNLRRRDDQQADQSDGRPR